MLAIDNIDMMIPIIITAKKTSPLGGLSLSIYS